VRCVQTSHLTSMALQATVCSSYVLLLQADSVLTGCFVGKID
jgi:hypothetical protein